MHTLKEAFDILEGYGLAKNFTVFKRWTREGRIPVVKPENERYYKMGYHIEDSELQKYIEKNAPETARLIKENEELKRRNTQLERENWVQCLLKVKWMLPIYL